MDLSAGNQIVSKTCALYNVGLKVLLRRNDEFLFLQYQNTFDLPGGRIDTDEALCSLDSIITREMREELGATLQYKLGKPIFQFRRFFPQKNINVFITVYEAEYISGAIQLSDEHDSFVWLSPENNVWHESMFCSKEEYLALSRYFESLSRNS